MTLDARMGSTIWRGDILHCGYQTCMAGKEIELDNQIPASQLPAIVGVHRDLETDSDSPPRPTSMLPQALAVKTNSIPPGRGFIDPTSFYGAPAKPKLNKPLCVPF